MGEALIQDIVVAAAIGLVLMVFVLVAYEGVRQKPSAKRPPDRSRQGEPYCAKAEPYSATPCAWDNHELFYCFANEPTDMTPDVAHTIIRDAFQKWADVTPLEFTETDDPAKAHIRIAWHRGEHGDATAFDGQGGTLAHCYFPPPCGGEHAGQLHFDEAETFTKDYSGIRLMSVAIHEIGHGLGLGHSDDPEAMMYPTYQRSVSLAEDDIQAIQSLYGRS